jgi:hypothetical protein
MPEYVVYFRTVASTAVRVEADDEDEAVEAAFEELPHLCAQCSGWGQRAGVELGDWQTLDEPWPAFPGEQTVEASDA